MGEIEKRKAEHLEICRDKNVEVGRAGFEDITFVYDPLPEIDYEEIDISTSLLGKKLDAPIMIEGMTGGTKEGYKVNLRLAEIAERYGVGMGVGSQRAAIEDPKLTYTYQVKKEAPDLKFLAANLGMGQLAEGYGAKEVSKAIEMIDADAISIHLNVRQELAQPEGDRNFKGITSKLKEICNSINYPVIAKGTGGGIPKEKAKILEEIGIACIDIGGKGGTSWPLVESYRSGKEYYKDLGQELADFGIPTVASTAEVVSTVKIPVISSGGIRKGEDIAKSIALGADLAGMALPLLRAYYKGNLDKLLNSYVEGLKTTMMLVGAKNLGELRKSDLIIKGDTASWLKSREINLKSFVNRI